MGILASLVSAALSASKDLISKKLAFTLDGATSTYASFAYALPFYLLVLAILSVLGLETFSYSFAFFGLVLLRSLTDVFAEGLKMYAFAHGDVSLVVTFFSLSPLFLLITSPLITQDPLSLPGTLAVVLVVGGSLALVYRPSAKGWAEQRKAILLAICAAVFFSLNSCFDRLAVQEGTPVVAGFTMTLLSAIVLLPFVLFSKQSRLAMRQQRMGLWARGGLEVGFMVCKLFALQYLHAPYVVVLQRTSLLLSIVGGRVIFNEEDFARRLAAGMLIVVGVGLVVWLHW